MSDAPTVELAWPRASNATAAGGDGRAEAVRPAPGESILDAAERAGVALPFGCRHGACGTCAARLVDGDRDAVRYRRPPRALNGDDVRAGYVLVCVATARANCRLRVGSDVLAETRPTPWRRRHRDRDPDGHPDR